MTKRLFSPRNLFLLLLPWILILSACGNGGISATEPAATVMPPGTPTRAPNAEDVPPAIPETRRLTLEFPPKIKAGAESEIVRLTLEVDDLGNITPTAEFEGNVVEGDVIEIPNLYETHNVVAEAQFDIAGLEVQPPGATLQPLKQGQPVTFYWSILPSDVGTYRGTIWLHLVFTERLSGEETRMAVSAQIVEIEAVDLFGFSTNFVRTSGVVGSVLGVIVGFPFFDDIVKYIWNRVAKKKRRGKSKRKI